MVVDGSNRKAIASWIYDEIDKLVPDLLNVRRFDVEEEFRFIKAIVRGLFEAERLLKLYEDD